MPAIPVIWILIATNAQGPFPMHMYPTESACNEVRSGISTHLPTSTNLKCIKYTVDGRNV